MRSMKRGILAFIVIAILAPLMLGVGMMSDEHPHSLCAISFTKQVPCPAEGVITSALFHLTGMKAMWTVVLQGSLLALLLLFVSFLLPIPPLLLIEQQREIKGVTKASVLGGVSLSWLCLRAHSPTMT
ncbi:MAG: hypothetical protein Q8P70_01500 [bacterium]|nr:hypothetical protein [bacterium]